MSPASVARCDGAGRDQDIDDVIQEAYCRLAAKQDISHIENGRAYLFQTTRNILDFGQDIDASVHLPRFGGIATIDPLSVHCEIDCASAEMRREMQRRGLQLDIISPWNYLSGTYEGVHFVADGHAEACADPRRAGQAEAV